MPLAERFSEELNGYPGIVSYGLGTPDWGLGAVSSRGWLVKTSVSANFSYGYFDQLIDRDDGNPTLAAGKLNNGVYKISGNQTIDDPWNVNANDSIVVLIDGSLTIGRNVQVANRGFLALIARNGITIADSVRRVQGVYLTDQILNTGSGTTQLTAEGIFAANSVSLGRTSATSATPAEEFIYRPDLVLNAPDVLKKSNYTWIEVVP